MTGQTLIGRRRLALLVVILLLMGGTALVAGGYASPKPVASAVLGTQWQCTSFAFLTTCTRLEPDSKRARGSGAVLPNV